jgi:hypothetical protein
VACARNARMPCLIGLSCEATSWAVMFLVMLVLRVLLVETYLSINVGSR